ncbi:MAG: regulator [Gammaproteobacteria bacterium]|nr:regulator [Gammaproteobacteria bacterium]
MTNHSNVSRTPQEGTEKKDAQKRIDDSLKSIYDETLNEELPDRFKDLIAELRKQDAQK